MALATKRWVNGRLEDVAPGAAHLRRLQYPGSGIDWSICAFGYSISGATVTVNAGTVRHGTRTPVVAASKDIVISADNTWIFVAYAFGGAVASITSSMSEPVDTEEVHNHVLYLVTLSEGVASIDAGNIKHLGDIWLPGVFA